MTNWKYTLEIKDAWQQTKAGEMTLPAFAAAAAAKARALPAYLDDDDLFGIVDELETIARDPEPDVEWFDRVWNELYDWADQVVGGWNDKMCWIRTF